jgi:hypothetical protein
MIEDHGENSDKRRPRIIRGVKDELCKFGIAAPLIAAKGKAVR